MLVQDFSTLRELLNKAEVKGYFNSVSASNAVASNKEEAQDFVGQLVIFRYRTLQRQGKVIQAKVDGLRKTFSFQSTEGFTISFIGGKKADLAIKDMPEFTYDSETDTLSKTKVEGGGGGVTGSLANNILIVWGVDASASMHSYSKAATKGIRDKFSSIKSTAEQLGQTVDIQVVEFSGSVRPTVEYSTKNNALSNYTLRPSGTTALNDAFIRCMEIATKGHATYDRVLVEIFTDGGENASRAVYSTVASEVKTFMELENSLIAFTGPKNDYTRRYMTQVGVDETNFNSFEVSNEGFEKMSSQSAQATTDYLTASYRGEVVKKSFYTDK